MENVVAIRSSLPSRLRGGHSSSTARGPRPHAAVGQDGAIHPGAQRKYGRAGSSLRRQRWSRKAAELAVALIGAKRLSAPKRLSHFLFGDTAIEADVAQVALAETADFVALAHAPAPFANAQAA
jgi:hypothetical protein